MAPVKSKPRAVPRLSVRKYGAAAMPPIATGTLTKKIHSQPAPSTRMPPATTPSVPPMPASAPQMPSARLRSRPAGKATCSNASAAGESSAAPMPWIARTAIRVSEFGANPPASEAAPNSARPIMKRRRRPSRSLARPPRNSTPPKGSAAPEQQQAAEGERVPVDDPLEAVGGEPEIGLDRGQGDVHDRDVEDDHELRDGEHRQCEPLACAP